MYNKTSPIAPVFGIRKDVSESTDARVFNVRCRDCARLHRFLKTVRRDHPGYWARPVPAFGDPRARLLVVGLAPGMHGANSTGRPFTGDTAGELLYRTLHQFGFASHTGSDDPRDGLRLRDCRVTNAVKCLPPHNKPDGIEVRNCNRYLAAEIAMQRPRAILALGAVAHRAVLQSLGLKPGALPFAHGKVHDLTAMRSPARLYDSYHCIRYNTQTRRLTAGMFEAVLREIKSFLSSSR